MTMISKLAELHREVTRRHFLRLGFLGAAGVASTPLWAAGPDGEAALEKLVEELEYLTPPLEFRSVERGNPLPYKLPIDKRREVGLERDTWKLEVIADPDTPAQVGNPLTAKNGNAFTFADLLSMGKKRSVRFLKVMTCNNIGRPLGMGLWEGVPLRDVIWKARPESRIRRVFYWGYHNDDPDQMFRSSLPIGRVLEDPPGNHPVILAYKLNGELLSGVRGGPVRMIVPEAYGFKSVKWLTHVVLSDLYHANDSYATMSPNDIDSHMKTFSRFLTRPKTVPVGQSIPLTGMAQVGVSGLKKVQYWIRPVTEPLPKDDPNFTTASWKDADILPFPKHWGGGVAEGKLPSDVSWFDPSSGKPQSWPMRYAMAHWAALADPLPVGKYEFRTRTIDENDIAQPMPRPFAKSGRNAIASFKVTVEA